MSIKFRAALKKVKTVPITFIPEHFNGNVTTAGNPITIIPTSLKAISYTFIQCNTVRDPVNPNTISDAIYFSLDNGVTYSTLMAGESIFVPGVYDNVKLDSNSDATNYQVIIWS